MHELRQDTCQQLPTYTRSWLHWVDLFAKARVLVIGDAIVDQYHFGRVDRLSPEAPVPIFIEESQQRRRGGADNVAHQLEALGCEVRCAFASSVWSVKHRYFAGHHLIFRKDCDRYADGNDVDSVSQRIDDHINQCDVVVLSDYNKGLLTQSLCQDVIRAGKPVVVDPKGCDWAKYHGAAVICPNSAELASVGPNDLDPETPIVEKRGPKGLKIHTPHEIEPDFIEATAKQVFDVTGAGDVVTAVIAAGVAVGAPLHVSATIANHAAAIVVGKLGTAVCSRSELMRALE